MFSCFAIITRSKRLSRFLYAIPQLISVTLWLVTKHTLGIDNYVDADPPHSRSARRVSHLTVVILLPFGIMF